MDGVEDGFEAIADGVQLLGGHVAGSAADFASAEGVDDEVEAVAGVVVDGGVDLVAGFGADGAVLVVAVGEGDAADRGYGDGAGGLRGGLGSALGFEEARGDGEVEEGSAEGGGGVGVEGDVGYGSELGAARGCAGVEVEGAEVAVAAAEVPGGGDLDGDAVAVVAEGAGGGGGGLGCWLGGEDGGGDGGALRDEWR